MGRGSVPCPLILLFLLALPAPLHAAKILTVCLKGGSHYLLMDEISHTFQQSGHEVRMLLQLGTPVITGLDYAGRADSYQLTSWSAGESYITQYNGLFLEQQREFLLGRDHFSIFLNVMGQLAYQCDLILSDKEVMSFLRAEAYDLAILDASHPCSFLLAHALGVRYVSFHPMGLNGPLSIGLPGPLSHVPVFRSQLSDRMTLWGRLCNLLWAALAPVGQAMALSAFRGVAERHLPPDAPPLSDMYLGSELWAFNTDFSLEFAQPLMPYTVCVGGLLSKPAGPLSQVLEDWISGWGEAGFVVVTLGSMLSSVPLESLLVEMSAGFSSLPQGVLWRYDPQRWPPHLPLPPNVRLEAWLPQNDLLGHPRARLLVTHGGQNSLLQAVYHAVPVLGIPLFGDQFDNMVRVEAKGLGVALRPTDITRELLRASVHALIQDRRYKTSALSLSRIHQSQPLSPGPRLVRWVEHILISEGGAHLRPASLAQTWYQRCMLDVALLLSLGLLGVGVLIWALVRGRNCSNAKVKLQ